MKNKSWYLEHPISDKKLTDTDGFIRYAAEIFLDMKPFNDYLNAVLNGFDMLAR